MIAQLSLQTRPIDTATNHAAPAHPGCTTAPAASEVNPAQMDLAALVQRCVVETNRFYRGQPNDTRYSYELFRRALVERSEIAWEHVYLHYGSLVESWVRRSSSFDSSGESSDYFTIEAFTRFWRAVTPERFADFPNLAALLQYLRLCATSVVIDCVRRQSWAEMLPAEAATEGDKRYAPDEEALRRVAREEFWRCIDTQLQGADERAVVYDSFVLGMTPRAIYARRREMFADVNAVYNIKRNVLGRLGRNPQIRQFIGGSGQ